MPPKKPPKFRKGERVALKGDKYQRPWVILAFPSHGTTILIQRENRTPSMYTQAFADPDDLNRLRD